MINNPMTAEEYAELATNILFSGKSPRPPMLMVRWAWNNLSEATQKNLLESTIVVLIDEESLKRNYYD